MTNCIKNLSLTNYDKNCCLTALRWEYLGAKTCLLVTILLCVEIILTTLVNRHEDVEQAAFVLCD